MKAEQSGCSLPHPGKDPVHGGHTPCSWAMSPPLLFLSSFFKIIDRVSLNNCPSLNSLCSPDSPWYWDPPVSDSRVAGVVGLCPQPGYSLILTGLVLEDTDLVLYVSFTPCLQIKDTKIDFFRSPVPETLPLSILADSHRFLLGGCLVLSQHVSYRSHHFPTKTSSRSNIPVSVDHIVIGHWVSKPLLDLDYFPIKLPKWNRSPSHCA